MDAKAKIIHAGYIYTDNDGLLVIQGWTVDFAGCDVQVINIDKYGKLWGYKFSELMAMALPAPANKERR